MRKLYQLLSPAEGTLSRLLQRSSRLEKLQKRVESLLPAGAVEHCRVINLRDNTLLLSVDSTAWATRLRYLQQAMIAELRDGGLPQLQGIQIRVAPVSMPAVKHHRTAKLSSQAATDIKACAESIADPELRKALLRLAGRGKPRD